MAVKIERKIKKEQRMQVVRNSIKFALLMAARYWKETCLPGHFKYGAGTKYGYHARTSKYIKRKIREGRENVFLVYTGRTRAMMLRSQTTPTVTTSRVTVRLPADKYIHLKMSGWGGKRLRDEITATTAAEKKEQGKIIRQAIGDMMSARKARNMGIEIETMQIEIENLQAEGIYLG